MSTKSSAPVPSPAGGGGGGSNNSWFPSDLEAHRAARDEVKNMFRSSEALPRLHVFLEECIRKKGAIEAQLSSAVRTQVDETRLGLQLLTEASGMMHTLRDHFHQIDSYCRDCKMVLRDTPEIARVNTARKNLEATTKLLDRFRSLPSQAEALLEELDGSDRAIKAVYKGLRQLFRLRDSAMDQQSAGSHPHGTMAGFSKDFLKQLQDNFSELNRSSEAVEERIWENMQDATFLAREDPVTLVRTLEVIEMEDRAMRKVLLLSKKAEGAGASANVTMRQECFNKLDSSIADLFKHLHLDEEQAKEQERKEAEAARKKQQAIDAKKKQLRAEEQARRKQQKAEERRRRREAGEDSDDLDEDDEDDEEQSDVEEPLDELAFPPILSPRHGSDADQLPALDVQEGSDDGPSDYMLKILEEMTDLVENLPGVLEALIPCFPPDYNLAHFYVERYCRYLKITLTFHAQEPSKLSKKAQLKSVNWIEWYRRELRRWERLWPGCTKQGGVSSLSSDPEAPPPRPLESTDERWLDKLVHELMTSYVRSIEDTLLRLVDNILMAEERAEPDQDEEGRFVTTGPADLFYTVNSTIEIVLSNFGLYPQPLSYVCLMLADLFTYYQNKQLRFLQHVEMEEDQLFFTSAMAVGADEEEEEEYGSHRGSHASSSSHAPPERLARGDTYFCAIINNCSTSQEHMEELKDKILDRLREAEGIEGAAPLLSAGGGSSSSSGSEAKTLLEQMEDTFDECGEGFVSVASEAIDLLNLQISVTLQKPMANLFTPSWQKDASLTHDIVFTLQDFCTDYATWIGRDAYFTRVLTNCLVSVIQEYFRKLTEVKPTLSETLFHRLKEDKQLLQQFFMQYSEGGTHPSGELLSASLIKGELSLLKLVHKVLFGDIDFLSVHFDVLIARFGPRAKEVMEGLLIMRPDLNRQRRKEVMEKFVAKMPSADRSAMLLQQQLMQQNVAALASPKSKEGGGGGGGGGAGMGGGSKSGGGGGQRRGDEASSGFSFWDRFKNREKKAEKARPSAQILQGKSANRARRQEEEGHAMSDFLA